MNALQDFLQELEKNSEDLTSRREKELGLWHTWNTNGRKPEDLQPLIQSFRGLINSRANVYTNRLRDIPPAAIKAEFTNHAVTAFETYDPSKGAGLYTHINNHLKKGRRFITTYQNVARIPENRVYQIRQFQDAETRLNDQLNRPPTQLEIADHLKWSPRQVDLMQKEIRKAHYTGGFQSDPTDISPSRHQEIVRLLPYELTPEENSVFEHIYGIGGKPVLSPGQIAKKLNMSAPKVSRLKKSIADKYNKYSDE
jgi:DNA-directed RNA polymerase specialized sigma subunit